MNPTSFPSPHVSSSRGADPAVANPPARERGGATSVQGKKPLTAYTKLVDKFKTQTDALAGLLEHSGGSAEKHAKYMRDKIVPAMAKLREVGDEIEVLTPHEIWPLPTYREMLFVK